MPTHEGTFSSLWGEWESNLKFTVWNPKSKAKTKIKAKAAVYDPVPDLARVLNHHRVGPATLMEIVSKLSETFFENLRAEFFEQRHDFDRVRHLCIYGGSLHGLTMEDTELAFAFAPLTIPEIIDVLQQ